MSSNIETSHREFRREYTTIRAHGRSLYRIVVVFLGQGGDSAVTTVVSGRTGAAFRRRYRFQVGDVARADVAVFLNRAR